MHKSRCPGAFGARGVSRHYFTGNLTAAWNDVGVMALQKSNHKPDEIACLYEITEALHATLDLRKSLYRVLDLLSQHIGMNRGSITLLNPETSEIHVEVAHGISTSEKSRGRYKLGEGITGRVIESGRPMAVPQID